MSFVYRCHQFTIFNAIMTNRLKLFQFTQGLFEDMGICSSQLNQRYRSINWRAFAMIISIIQMFLCSFAFLVFKAETFIDAVTSFYATNTELFSLIFLYLNFNNMLKILKLIERFEEIIENS